MFMAVDRENLMHLLPLVGKVARAKPVTEGGEWCGRNPFSLATQSSFPKLGEAEKCSFEKAKQFFGDLSERSKP
jgi:hypothetical protein